MAKKEVRFRTLVDTAGRPEVVFLWSDPKRDRGFMRAVKEHRVLTVLHEPRLHRKDYGRAGFHPDPYASYLVFPKPIPVDKDSRVIGITFDLVVEPKDVRPAAQRLRPVPPPVPQPRPAKRYNVILRRTAVIETGIEVLANSARQARQKAMEQVRMEPFDGSKAIIRNQVLAISPI